MRTSFWIAGVIGAVVLAWGWLPLVEIPPEEAGGGAGVAANEIKYGVVIDAGSSGSRVYVFTWLASEPHGTLAEVMHKKVAPGVSAYAANPVDAAESVWGLLEVALEYIPKDAVASTPITLQATAGMRLLPPAESEAVLVELRKMLESSPFDFVGGAYIVDGCSEGRYLFHAVNSALGQLGRSTDLVGTLDLGGASTQIAMPLPNDEAGPFRFDVFACPRDADCNESTLHTPLYTVSRLSYGLNEAWKGLLSHETFTPEASSPCLFPGQQEEVGGRAIAGTGNFEECLALMRPFVAQREELKMHDNPDQSTMPPLALENKYYATDHFSKLTIPLFEYNGKVEKGVKVLAATAAQIQTEAKIVCGKEFEGVMDFMSNVKLSKRKKACFASAYIVTLLELYGFPETFAINYALEINGVDMNWPLGAIIEMMGAVQITPLQES